MIAELTNNLKLTQSPHDPNVACLMLDTWPLKEMHTPSQQPPSADCKKMSQEVTLQLVTDLVYMGGIKILWLLSPSLLELYINAFNTAFGSTGTVHTIHQATKSLASLKVYVNRDVTIVIGK